MILPEAAICSSPTGAPGPCDCFNTGIKKNFPGLGEKEIKISNPAAVINGQIIIGGEERCNGIDNNQTLLPVIDKLCPCISGVQGFNLAGISQEKKEELLDCVEKDLNDFGNNPAVARLTGEIALCTLLA